MAVQRGLESARPAQTRLFQDPLAGWFVSPAWRVALRGARFVVVRRAIEAIYDFVGGPGPRASAIARTKQIDEIIGERAPSVDQLVILGAGYDTRAHRLACLADRAVFEIDHPDTQAPKVDCPGRRQATSIAPRMSRSTSSATTSPPLDRLRLSVRPRTYFYGKASPNIYRRKPSTRPSPRSTKRDATAAAGVHLRRRRRREGRARSIPEAARWLHGTAKRGEPWIFGLTPAHLHDYLRRRGFCLVSDLSTREAGERYFTPPRRPDRGSDLYHVATATID